MAHNQDSDPHNQLVQRHDQPAPEKSLSEVLGGASDERPTDNSKEEQSYHVAAPPWWCPVKGCDRSKDFPDHKRKHDKWEEPELTGTTAAGFHWHLKTGVAICSNTPRTTMWMKHHAGDYILKKGGGTRQVKTQTTYRAIKPRLEPRRRRQQPHPSESSGSGSGSDSDSSESESEEPSSIVQTQDFFGFPHNSVDQQGNLNAPHPDFVAVPQLNFPPRVFDGSQGLAHNPPQSDFNPQGLPSFSTFGSQPSMFNSMIQQGHIAPSNIQHFQSNTTGNSFGHQVAHPDNLGPFFPEYSGHQEIFLPPDELHHNSEASNMLFNPQSQLGLASQTSPLPQAGNHVGYDGAFQHVASEVGHILGHVPDTWEDYGLMHDANSVPVPLEGLNLNHDPNQFQPVQRAQLHQSTQPPLDQAHPSGIHHPHHIHDANMHSGPNTQNNPGPWWAGSLGSHYHGLRRRSKRKAVLLRKWAEDQ
ncbi:hypothetical protein T439DRAFT_381553 [Meredithblackwellia eburnea MCA 4105]